MAKPIKETPILQGQDAVRFERQMKISEQTKVTSEVSQRMKSNYEKIKGIIKF